MNLNEMDALIWSQQKAKSSLCEEWLEWIDNA